MRETIHSSAPGFSFGARLRQLSHR
jgi:hypothetical protein